MLSVSKAPINRTHRLYVAGHNGLAGSAIWRSLKAAGFDDVVGARSSLVDLRDRSTTFDFVMSTRPDVVVLAAARSEASPRTISIRQNSCQRTCRFR